MEKIDFLAIGDIVTDAFIQLHDAWIEIDNPDKTKELCMRFGEKIPYENVDIVRACGNSPNAAVGAHRLGLRTALLTDLGDDKIGQECIDALHEEGVSTEYVKIHRGQKSNYHYVLRYQAERTILIKHEHYDYFLPDFSVSPRWIYLSSMGEDSLHYHDEIADYLETHPETKLSFQPGTFQIKLRNRLSRLYKVSEIFFCNKEEAQSILETRASDIKVLLEKLRDWGPKIVVITDGPNGAYAFDGESMWFHPIYPDPAPPVDRTGAGDSFASTFTSAIALGKSVEEALLWGPINSMSVVQYIGAQKGLLTEEKLREFLKNAPVDYKPQKIR